MIIKQLQLIYIHIPKTGGSSIERIISDKCYDGRIIIGHFIHETAIKLIKREPKFKDYYIFTTVRNPYDRLISQYRFDMQKMFTKRSKHDTIPRHQQRYYIEFSDDGKPTLEKFILWIDYIYSIFNKHRQKYGKDVYKLKSWSYKTFRKKNIYRTCEYDGSNYIYETQYNALYDKTDKLMINYVMKLENIETDWEIIRHKYDLDKMVHVNKSDDSSAKFTKFDLPKTTLKKIYRMHKMDFHKFKYPRNIYLDLNANNC